MRPSNTFWKITTVLVLLVGIGGYLALAEQGVVPKIPIVSSTTDAFQATDTKTPELSVEEGDVTPVKNTSTTPPPTPKYLDIKDVYDTNPYPGARSDNLSGTKDMTIRARLRVIKAEVFCIAAPCPQPDSSQYRFQLVDYYEGKYVLSVRKTGDPVVKDLKDGQVYEISGTLNYAFSATGEPQFTFDPVSIVK